MYSHVYQYRGPHWQKACIPAQVSSQLEAQDKIKAEMDDSLQEYPELQGVMHEVEWNKCTTSGEITTGRPVAKAYWTERSSLKLVCGCLHRVWKCANGETFRVLRVVSKVRTPEVLNVQYKGPRGQLRITKTLEKLKQGFYWTGCPQSALERIAKYAEYILAKGSRSRSHQIGVDVDGSFPSNIVNNIRK